jgi:broad specificity phosphatase PhoE
MALTVTLVRHGQTERSSRGAYSGQLDVPLTSLGREQALRCAEQLAGAGGVDAVYTSPLVRARQTAQAIAHATGASLTIDDRLIELDYGPFEGLDREGARETFGQAFDDWRADPFGSPVEGMEPLPAALRRASAATADALAASDHPVLVGHQGILRIVLISLGELEPDAYFSQRLQEAEPIIITDPAIVKR